MESWYSIKLIFSLKPDSYFPLSVHIFLHHIMLSETVFFPVSTLISCLEWLCGIFYPPCFRYLRVLFISLTWFLFNYNMSAFNLVSDWTFWLEIISICYIPVLLKNQSLQLSFLHVLNQMEHEGSFSTFFWLGKWRMILDHVRYCFLMEEGLQLLY